jgi:hypothetical protein
LQPKDLKPIYVACYSGKTPDIYDNHNVDPALKIGKKVFTQDQYRTADAIKEAICASFKKAPKECKTEIKAANTAAAGTANTAAAAGGSCN